MADGAACGLGRKKRLGEELQTQGCSNTSALDISTLRHLRVRALDCEMVGVGPRGKRSVLIRVSVVSRRGKAWVFLGKGGFLSMEFMVFNSRNCMKV